MSVHRKYNYNLQTTICTFS